jgi:hypothetical protein
LADGDFYHRLQQKRCGPSWIGMPFCFTTQLQQRAIATELAALRRLAKAPKPRAKPRSLHGPERPAGPSKASQIRRPHAPARKAKPR